jgi:hypothetical protein
MRTVPQNFRTFRQTPAWIAAERELRRQRDREALEAMWSRLTAPRPAPVPRGAP